MLNALGIPGDGMPWQEAAVLLAVWVVLGVYALWKMP